MQRHDTPSFDFMKRKRQPSPMRFILSTHNVTLTKAIEDHIVTRLNQLEHLDRFAIDARVILEHDTTKATDKQFKCSMRLAMPGPDLYAADRETDLYAAIDLVAKKIEQQIRKRHNKYTARRHSEAARTKRKRQEAGL
jgi:putative sigma-54 modulation protein